jgi:hypothetical protein
VTAEREDEIHLGADALDQASHLSEIRPGVEVPVDRPDDVDLRLLPGLSRSSLGSSLGTELGPEPEHGPIGTLPLILVDRPGQEALQVGAFGRHTSTDHLGDRAGDDDARQILVERRVGATHGVLGAVLPEFLLAESRHHDGEFVGRKRIGVVQHGGDG